MNDMKLYIRHIAIAAVLLLGLTACEGFLDTVPTSSVVDKNAMVTLADAGVACNGLYTPLNIIPSTVPIFRIWATCGPTTFTPVCPTEPAP